MMFYQYFQGQLEDRFTVVQWDQRGTGKSFSENIPGETMTLDQITSDAIELIDILRNRYGKEKVYIAGHSWGSIVGIHLAKAFEDRILGFIGIGQVVDYQKSTEVFYDFALSSAKSQNCDEIVEELNRIGRPPFDDDSKPTTVRKFVEQFGGGLHNFISFRDIASECKEYSEQDIMNVSKGLDFSGRYLWKTVLETEFLNKDFKLNVPIYLFNGRHDYQTPLCLVEQYYEKLDVPKKKLVTFEDSAHFPFIEERDKFCNELIKILDES